MIKFMIWTISRLVTTQKKCRKMLKFLLVDMGWVSQNTYFPYYCNDDVIVFVMFTFFLSSRYHLSLRSSFYPRVRVVYSFTGPTDTQTAEAAASSAGTGSSHCSRWARQSCHARQQMLPLSCSSCSSVCRWSGSTGAPPAAPATAP